MEVQLMTVTVNADNGFPGECGTYIQHVKFKIKNKHNNKSQIIKNTALILVLTHYVSHLTTDLAMLQI